MSDFARLVADDYDLIRELGRGGMGIVHLARDLKLDRLVALKVLPPAGASNEGLRDRFLREARTAAQLSHPNIVPVYRADQIDGFAFFAMGFVDGESLAERLARLGSIAPAEAVRLLREVAWALAYAHARGVIHRDIKPENLMIEKATGHVVVTDFGIARDLRATRLTEDGQVLGSVHYMSPEQIAGGPVDGRSDLYSLGVVGFQCLAGRLPFDAAQASAVLVQHAVTPPAPLRSVAPEVPPPLAAVIDRCLAKDPAERFPTGESLAAALAAALEDHPPPSEGSVALSEADARAIWRRAAELQIDAATRIRRRSDTAALPLEADHSSGGYRVAEIRTAAEEAGIGAEFVALAMAERTPGGAVATQPTAEGEERTWTTMLGTSARSITVQRTFPAPPRRVLDAIGKVFPAQPYALKLRDTVGGHPLDGGVMVFEVPMLRAGTVVGGQGISMFSYRMTSIEVDRVTVRIRAVDGARSTTEVTIHGDLRSGLRKNWKVDRGIAATMAVVGGGLAAAIGIGPLALGLMAAAPAAAGAALLGAGSLGWYRWLYRSALTQSHAELERLLAAVDGEIRSEMVFGDLRTQRLPPGSEGGSAWPPP